MIPMNSTFNKNIPKLMESPTVNSGNPREKSSAQPLMNGSRINKIKNSNTLLDFNPILLHFIFIHKNLSFLSGLLNPKFRLNVVSRLILVIGQLQSNFLRFSVYGLNEAENIKIIRTKFVGTKNL